MALTSHNRHQCPICFPASVLVDAEVGCQSLYSDCPTYDAECSLVNLSDSKRFCRSGLDVVQQMIYMAGLICQSTCLSRPKSFVNGHDIMFFIFSCRTENPSPQQWCPRDRGARQPLRRHCCIRGTEEPSPLLVIEHLLWLTRLSSL